MASPTEREIRMVRLMLELKAQKKEASKLWEILYNTYTKTPEYQAYAKVNRRISEIEEELRDMRL